MINVLPKTEKRRIRREYRLRLLTLAGAIGALVGVVGTILLLPSFFLAQAAHDSAAQTAALLTRSIKQEKADVPAQLLTRVEEQLELVRGGAERSPRTALTRVLAHTPPGMRLERFRYQRNDESAILRVGGVAARRADVRAFVQALQEEAMFNDVEFPVEDLARDTNIPFSLRISGPF